MSLNIMGKDHQVQRERPQGRLTRLKPSTEGTGKLVDMARGSGDNTERRDRHECYRYVGAEEMAGYGEETWILQNGSREKRA